MKNYDLTKILKPEHSGKWVALTPGRYKVVDYDEKLMELYRRLGKKAMTVTFMKVT